MNEQTFYMVFVEGGNAPTYRHSSYELALAEAKRLSSTLQKKAWVLEAISRVQKIEFEVTPLVSRDDLPF